MPEEDLQPNTEAGTEGEKPEVKTFTQDDVNRIARETKTQTKASAVKELMEQLGIEDVESAKTLLEEAKQRKDAEKSEAQREKEAAKQSRKAADNERLAAQEERLTVKVERELLRAGLPAEKLDRVTRSVSLNLDATDEDIKAEVEALKADMPEVFAAKQGATGSHVSGRSPSSQTTNDANPLTAGAERAKQWKPSIFGR